jgi:hypothetical protein
MAESSGRGMQDQLLERLDDALERAWLDEVYTDEINE